jgi:hypothetical protein
MSRYEKHGSQYSIAYGVDWMPTIGVFVQVWDTTKYDMPDPDNIVAEYDGIRTPTVLVDTEFIVQLAKEHGIELDPVDVYGHLD